MYTPMQTTLTDHTQQTTRPNTLPNYNAITSHEDLIEYCKAYSEQAIEEHDYDLTLDLVTGWTVSEQMKRQAAHVKYPDVRGAAAGIPIDWERTLKAFSDPPERFDSWKECTVRVSWDAFERFDEDTFQSVLRHELIHVEEYQKFGATNHGPAFKSRAGEVDAVMNCDKFTDYKYRLFCKECDQFVGGRHQDCKTVSNPEDLQTNCCGVSPYVEEN